MLHTCHSVTIHIYCWCNKQRLYACTSHPPIVPATPKCPTSISMCMHLDFCHDSSNHMLSCSKAMPDWSRKKAKLLANHGNGQLIIGYVFIHSHSFNSTQQTANIVQYESYFVTNSKTRTNWLNCNTRPMVLRQRRRGWGKGSLTYTYPYA